MAMTGSFRSASLMSSPISGYVTEKNGSPSPSLAFQTLFLHVTLSLAFSLAFLTFIYPNL